jgi:hypothetical protein
VEEYKKVRENDEWKRGNKREEKRREVRGR